MNKLFRTLAVAVLLAAPAAPALAEAQAPAEAPAGFDMERLQPWAEIESLAWPLMVAAAPQCKDPSYRAGFELLGSSEQGLVVRSVATGSPADGALTVGDRVVALDGERFAEDGAEAFAYWTAGMRAEQAESDAVQRWTVLRDGEERTVDLTPVSVCHLDIYYIAGGAPSVLRREGLLMLTPAIWDIAPEPWMVQAQIAHDLGHRLAQHEKANTRSRRWLSIAGNVVGALGGPNIGGAGQALALRKRPEQEVEADRAGIDLAVSIGLPEAELIQYWVEVIELEAGAGSGASWLAAHPAHHSRIEALEERYRAATAAAADAAAGDDPEALYGDA